MSMLSGGVPRFCTAKLLKKLQSALPIKEKTNKKASKTFSLPPTHKLNIILKRIF